MLDWVTQCLDIDIYILREGGEYVYSPAPSYKRRKSILLFYQEGHYECLGRVSRQGELRTRFSHQRSRIRGLYQLQIEAAQKCRALLKA